MIPYRPPTPPAPEGVTFGPPKPWVPGDPLWCHRNPNSGWLYNFRDDDDRETCNCSDAADWPAQNNRPISRVDRDELGDFIAAVKADRGDVA